MVDTCAIVKTKIYAACYNKFREKQMIYNTYTECLICRRNMCT